MWNAITDVPGVKVGQVTDPVGLTGVTAIILEGGAICASDVRGSNPGTFNTDAMDPLMANRTVHGVCLTGGSIFGLQSAFGIMRWLEEKGFGVKTSVALIPVVPGAVVFDLGVGSPWARPTADDGYRAAAAAESGPVAQGNVGAGTGVTTGKYTRGTPLKGGTGTASVTLPGGIVVGAIAIVNAVGDVVHPKTGQLYATHGGYDSVETIVEIGSGPVRREHENTTIACVATNARLDKTQLRKVAQMAHNALARAIRPIHTMRDGDAVFAVRVLEGAVDPPGAWWGEETDIIGGAAEDVLLRAIVSAVQHASAIPGFPAFSDR